MAEDNKTNKQQAEQPSVSVTVKLPPLGAGVKPTGGK
jgi:hypothetical protein